jgi:hypothetical protein
MAVFDDIESTEKLKVYDKSAEQNGNYNSFAEYVTCASATSPSRT